jgi:hypothetical protein
MMKSHFLEQPIAHDSRSASERKSGRAAFTDDGRSIWEWQTATGVFTRTITDEQLASLEATNLRIEEAPGSEMNAHSLTGRSLILPLPRRIVPAQKATSVGALQGLMRRLMGST